MFHSIPVYRKIVFLTFLIENIDDLLNERGFQKDNVRRLLKGYRKLVRGQIEDCFHYIKNEAESIIAKLFDK